MFFALVVRHTRDLINPVTGSWIENCFSCTESCGLPACEFLIYFTVRFRLETRTCTDCARARNRLSRPEVNFKPIYTVVLSIVEEVPSVATPSVGCVANATVARSCRPSFL